MQPINNEKYNVSLANSCGLLTGGGFEGPAEALFLNKKVLVMPMKYQYEQLCNAEAAKKLGVPVIYQLNEDFIPQIKAWLASENTIKVNYPDNTSSIVAELISKYS